MGTVYNNTGSFISMLINLFFNWYESKDRQEEINEALGRNNKIFDRVIVVEGRPTFEELFAMSQPGYINCYCNSDIYFTDLTLIRQIRDNECYAITRDDLRRTNNAPGSQDAWCFKGKVKPISAPFTMGLWGCDNRVAHEIKRAGYDVLNPPVYIGHLHKVDNRNQVRSKLNTVPPPYLLVEPMKLTVVDYMNGLKT